MNSVYETRGIRTFHTKDMIDLQLGSTSKGNHMSDRSIAPLFDFGLGLFEHDLVYEDLHFRDCIKKMNSKPFNRDNQKVIGFLQKEINIFDYLPDTLDLEGVVIPSVKATLYIKSCCSNLSIGLRG